MGRSNMNAFQGNSAETVAVSLSSRDGEWRSRSLRAGRDSRHNLESELLVEAKGDLARVNTILREIAESERPLPDACIFRMTCFLESSSAQAIVDFAKASVVANAWLRGDETRSPSLYGRAGAHSWPETYCSLIADPDYRPGAEEALGDYLIHVGDSPSALDLLPVFASLHPDLVSIALGREVKPCTRFGYAFSCKPFQMPGMVERKTEQLDAVVKLSRDRKQVHEICCHFSNENRRSDDYGWGRRMRTLLAA